MVEHGISFKRHLRAQGFRHIDRCIDDVWNSVFVNESLFMKFRFRGWRRLSENVLCPGLFKEVLLRSVCISHWNQFGVRALARARALDQSLVRQMVYPSNFSKDAAVGVINDLAAESRISSKQAFF